MIKVALGAFAYGFMKAKGLGAVGRPMPFGTLALHAALEEVTFRGGVERTILPALGASPLASALSSAVWFGSGHGPSAIRMGEAALAGLAYSAVYTKFGLAGAIAAHLAHNLGVTAGMRVIKSC